MTNGKCVYFVNDQGEEEAYAVATPLAIELLFGYEHAFMPAWTIPAGDGWEYPPNKQNNNGVDIGCIWQRRVEERHA